MASFTQAVTHFKVSDPALAQVLSRMKPRELKPMAQPDQYFARLCEDIISQQLGLAAADAIIARFRNVFGDVGVTPASVLAQPEEVYRGLGTSWAKARYVRALANAVTDGTVSFSGFDQASDEKIITQLTQVKGIGRWTAEMFLIFTLGRADIFSFGDLGLKNGFTIVYGAEADMATITKRWAPFRSYGSLALWHAVDEQRSKAKKKK